MVSLEKSIKKIKDLEIQGANNIAIYALKFLKQFSKKNGFGLKFETASYFLKESRPTAVVLHNCIEKLNKSKSISTINELIKFLENVNEKEIKYSDKIIKNNSKIMTYCHSGEAVKFIIHSFKKHKNKISVIACQTSPKEQGLKTVNDMKKSNVPVTLINDNAADFFMKEVDMVIVGADSLRKEGLVNKIGTSLIAKSAKYHKKPFYVIANSMKIDRRKKFKIEERSPKEIIKKLINKKYSKGIKIRNPAFDITPWEFVTKIISDKGIKTPKQLLKFN